ncbi:hypothetical protein VQ643_10010 [Pseudomonas sp. F1_0610]|uniref:hypothetical protein n=1 Tax=Pseudomonas sp. F1_0610 TaxID=3114284 RepID=UPI0039C11911
MSVLQPIDIHLDAEDSDDDFFNLGFEFDRALGVKPDYLCLCRDFYEAPEFLYIEAEDQIFGFYTQKASFTIERCILTIRLHDQQVFHWNQAQQVQIALDPKQLEQVRDCLVCMFDFT